MITSIILTILSVVFIVLFVLQFKVLYQIYRESIMTFDNKEMVSVYYLNNGDGTFTKTAKVTFLSGFKDDCYIEPVTFGRKWKVTSDVQEFYDFEIDSFFKEAERKFEKHIQKSLGD